jgi:hypothetical protein
MQLQYCIQNYYLARDIFKRAMIRVHTATTILSEDDDDNDDINNNNNNNTEPKDMRYVL